MKLPRGSIVLIGAVTCIIAWVGTNAAGKLTSGQQTPSQTPYPTTDNPSASPPVPATLKSIPDAKTRSGETAWPTQRQAAGATPQFQLPVAPQATAGEVQEIPASAPLEKRPDGNLAEPPPGQNNDNPTGRQEPCVALEWIGPPTAKLGQTVTIQIMVKNISATAVQGVTVRNRIPTGVTVINTQPKARNEGDVLSWEIGALEPREEKRLNLQVQPMATGDLASQASVTFTGTSTAHLVVQEPKLALKASAPDKVILNDPANLTLVVTNPGNGTAEQVKIKAVLSEGLESPRGRVVEFDVGSLRPQESRNVQLVCNTKAGGEQRFEAVATAEGNLRAEANKSLEVIVPRIDLTASGPRLRYLGRPASYVFKVTNPGSAPTTNVTLTDQIPDGFKFTSASAGGRHDFTTRTVTWYIGELSPGQSKEVSLDVMAVNPGEHKHQAIVEAARGLRNETQIVTRVEGLSALLMELVDLDDPVETGTDTAYEIRVTNTGSKTETNLQLICTIPQEMEFRGAKSGANCKYHLQGKQLIFEPLPKLAPRADVIYRVNVRGVLAGDVRFRAQITADGLKAPVLKEESTKVYGDSVVPTNASNPNP